MRYTVELLCEEVYTQEVVVEANSDEEALERATDGDWEEEGDKDYDGYECLNAKVVEIAEAV